MSERYPSLLRRCAPLFATLILLQGVGRIVATYPVFSHTWDEPAHVATGMEWLDRGSYTYETLHPPLARVMVALGLWLTGSHSAGLPNIWDEGDAILHMSGDYAWSLALARLGVLPFFLLAAGLVWRWGLELFGQRAALAATVLFTTLPPVVAHAGLATTDMAVTATLPLAVYGFAKWLERPSFGCCVALGVAIGGAMLSKLSTLVLLPACILAMFGWRWAVNVHRCHSDRASTGVFYGPAGSQIPGLRPSVTVACAILIVLWAGYRFSLVPVTTAAARPHTSVDQVVGPTGALHDLAYAIVEFPMLPLSELVQGIADLAEHNAAGRHSYLLGQVSDTGRLWFFPIALMVKTPVPFLLLTAVGGAMSLRTSWRSGIWKTAVPALSAAAILLAVLPSRINLGVRHVLPIYPFLAIVAGLGLARLAELAHPRFAGPVAAALLLGWHLASGLAVHPDYIAYFNEAVGQHPDRVLVDSDLDWGQDLYRLRDTLHRLEITELAALIHGHTGMHDLTRHDLSAVRPFDPKLPPHGWVAISVYYLRMDPRLSWLLACEPVATVGRSIRLYHFQADELPRAIGMHPARNC